MDWMQPSHGRPSVISAEAGTTSGEANEPVEVMGAGDSADVPLDTHETVEEIVTVNGDEIDGPITVDIGGAAVVVAQDNGTEAGHGMTMKDVSMDDGAATVEGIEASQDELTI